MIVNADAIPTNYLIRFWRSMDKYLNNITAGDCEILLQDLPENSIDLVVTSPPYDNLRSYHGYNFDFEPIALRLSKVIKPGGVIVWVVGDATIDGSETGTSFRQALRFMGFGLRLHDTMIYQKPGMRYPDSMRYNSVFEYMFILSKGSPKTFNPIIDKKNIYAGGKIARAHQLRKPDGEIGPNSAYKNDPNRKISPVGCRDNVWVISSGSENAKGRNHPAAFPEKLARDHILSWSNPGDIVLDPMCGSGTTCKMAKEHGRQFIGFDISEEYCELARKRVAGANVPLFTMEANK